MELDTIVFEDYLGVSLVKFRFLFEQKGVGNG